MEASSTTIYSLQGKDLNSSNSYCKQRPDVTASRKLPKMTGCLEIIEGEVLDGGQSKMCQDSSNSSRPSSNAGDRPWSQCSVGCFPPRTDSSLSRRMNTPTKQISLQAVRRKEESTDPFVDQVDLPALTLGNSGKIWKPETKTGYSEPTKHHVQAESFRLETVVENSWQLTEQSVSGPRKGTIIVTSQTQIICDDGIAAQENGVSRGENNREEKNTDDSDEDEGCGDDDDDSDSSEDEEEKLRAPNELLMEFVDCLMRKDFQTASKLCQMILLYEPENPEALKFKPLIDEKLVLDAEAEKEAADESNDDGDDSEDDSEDDDDGSDDSKDDDGDSSSDTDSSDEDDDGSDNDDCNGGNKESGNNNNNNRIQQYCRQRHLN